MNTRQRVFVMMTAVASCLGGVAGTVRAAVCNIKVVTDASPDYTDMPNMIHSITAKWCASILEN
jgi:hypothetical protein